MTWRSFTEIASIALRGGSKNNGSARNRMGGIWQGRRLLWVSPPFEKGRNGRSENGPQNYELQGHPQSVHCFILLSKTTEPRRGIAHRATDTNAQGEHGKSLHSIQAIFPAACCGRKRAQGLAVVVSVQRIDSQGDGRAIRKGPSIGRLRRGRAVKELHPPHRRCCSTRRRILRAFLSSWFRFGSLLPLPQDTVEFRW